MATKTITAAPSADITEALPVTAETAKTMTDHVEAAKRGTWEEALKAVKAAMSADTRKLNALDKARAALLDTRCEVIRATAHAMTFPESHAKAGTKAGQPSQSVIAEALGYNRLTFAPYFKAAENLYALFPELETGPGRAISEPEREHVASFWKSEALRAKAKRDAAKAKAEAPKNGPVETIPGKGEGEGTKGTDGGTSVTYDSIMAHMALLNKAIVSFTADNGFTRDQGVELVKMLSNAEGMVHKATTKK